MRRALLFEPKGLERTVIVMAREERRDAESAALRLGIVVLGEGLVVVDRDLVLPWDRAERLGWG